MNNFNFHWNKINKGFWVSHKQSLTCVLRSSIIDFNFAYFSTNFDFVHMPKHFILANTCIAYFWIFDPHEMFLNYMSSEITAQQWLQFSSLLLELRANHKNSVCHIFLCASNLLHVGAFFMRIFISICNPQSCNFPTLSFYVKNLPWGSVRNKSLNDTRPQQ